MTEYKPELEGSDSEGSGSEGYYEGEPHPVENMVAGLATVASSARELWNNLQSSVSFTRKRAASSSSSSSKLECSFVQPTLMSLGKFDVDQTNDLLHVLQGQPFALWNLSDRNFSSDVRNALGCQVLDVPWLVSGQFSQLPSLDCIFNLCYSIKSWLDLHSDHVAVIHCQNGRSRSGILIACFLKYISAFETTSHAFDFFCSSRAQVEIKASLAPSYRILFENMDKMVDQKITTRFRNKPVHLKTLAISGLPVDEIPCLEIWDITGQVYISHQNFKVKKTNENSWSSEYGDGIFRVDTDLLGDFSVMVRFGGAHAIKRDKTTIIFKYHNHTGILIPDALELRKQNVDVNPEYDDSLDVELFSVHLTLEPSSQDKIDFISQESSITPLSNDSRLTTNEGLFEAGLDEISKLHGQMPDSDMHAELLRLGHTDSFATVALQLSSNKLDQAIELVELMKIRTNEQQQHYSTPTNLNFYDESKDESPGINKTWKIVGNELTPVSGSSDLLCRTTTPIQNIGIASIGNDFVSGGADSALMSLPNTEGTDSPIIDAADSNGGVVENISVYCHKCNKDITSIRDQLVPCANCRKYYHTACVDKRKIPFGVKTARDRQNREKYIHKYFSEWLCSCCSRAGKTLLDGLSHVTSPSSDMLVPTPVKTPINNSDLRLNEKICQTPAEKFAKMLALGLPVAAVHAKMQQAGVDPEEVKRSSSQFNKNTTLPSSTRSQTNEEIEVATQIVSTLIPDVILSSEEIASAIKYAKYEKLRKFVSDDGIRKKMSADGVPTPDIDSFISASDLKLLPKSSPAQANTPLISSSLSKDHAATPTAVRVSENPMASLLASISARKPKDQEENKISNKVIETVGNVVKEPMGTSSADGETVALKDHPVYSKYFKMLKMGIPLPAVKIKMTQEGEDSAIIDRNPMDLYSLDSSVKKTALISSIPSQDTEEKPPVLPADTDSTNEDLVPLKDHPIYSKYFTMLKVGLPPPVVKHKMMQEGADPSVLDKNSSDMYSLTAVFTPSVNTPSTTTTSSTKMKERNVPGADWVALKDHTVYGKYYKMLKMGLPIGAAKNRMVKEGVDPTILDRQADELVPPGEDIGESLGKDSINNDTSTPVVIKKRGPRRKRLYWKSLDASKVTEGSLWADDEEQNGIDIDEEEFAKLFVDANSPRKITGELISQSGAKKMTNTPTKKQVVYLIDMKRGQNACIALSRVKVSFTDIRRKLSAMEDKDFSADFLGFIKEYLPTYEETAKLKGYKGDKSVLGQAEVFMLEMLDFPSAPSILDCLLFKKQYAERADVIERDLLQLENACNDVKSNRRLKKVMKTILKVGNQMNADNDTNEKSHGFSLDSLLKLQSAKAFDKKTSILQYVIMIIHRNDEDCLQFPEDLAHVGVLAKVGLESLRAEKEALDNELGLSKAVVAREVQRGGSIDLSTVGFVSEAVQTSKHLDSTLNQVNETFLGLLSYFGEEPGMPSSEFFATLHRFITEFIKDRKIHFDNKKKEERAAAKAATSSSGSIPGVQRRSSVMAIPSHLLATATKTVDSGNKEDSQGNKKTPTRRGTIM